MLYLKRKESKSLGECQLIDELWVLQGFCDDETNKRLLKKNNGSIKRVVMDLLAGEKP